MDLVEVNSVDETDPIWGLAMSMASKSRMKFKLGAVIFRRGKLIGFGYNSYKTHPTFGSKEHYKTLHAEGDALYCAKKLGNDTEGATMIIYRVNNRNAKPCQYCQQMLKKAGIKKVIYTNYE